MGNRIRAGEEKDNGVGEVQDRKNRNGRNLGVEETGIGLNQERKNGNRRRSG